jgi:hypothetical protein
MYGVLTSRGETFSESSDKDRADSCRLAMRPWRIATAGGVYTQLVSRLAAAVRLRGTSAKTRLALLVPFSDELLRS